MCVLEAVGKICTLKQQPCPIHPFPCHTGFGIKPQSPLKIPCGLRRGTEEEKGLTKLLPAYTILSWDWILYRVYRVYKQSKNIHFAPFIPNAVFSLFHCTANFGKGEPSVRGGANPKFVASKVKEEKITSQLKLQRAHFSYIYTKGSLSTLPSSSPALIPHFPPLNTVMGWTVFPHKGTFKS